VGAQLHPDVVVMVKVPVPPAAFSETLNGDSAYEQDADCVTTNVWPPIVMTPLREASVVFAATVYVRVPLRLPLAGETVSQVLSLVAVDSQPAPAVIEKVPVEPPDPIETPVGASTYVHGEVDAA